MTLHLITSENFTSIDDQLSRGKELQLQIATLQKELDGIKDSLKSGYFSTHDEYRNSKQVIIATYYGHSEKRFLTTKISINLVAFNFETGSLALLYSYFIS